MTEIQSFKGEWLPSIPVDWIQKKIKHVFNIRKVISGELGHDVISITQRGAKIKDIESGDGQLSMDYSKYQLVRCGDFLMNHMDLLTGYIDIAMFDGVTSPDYRVFELIDKNSFPKYHLYLFQHCYKSRVFYGYGRGSSQLGRWRFPTVEFENFFVPVPSYEEQQLISRYLDKKTEQIDSLVEKIQKKIELLKEQRTSLINQCVTKGLDKNVEMKDSGVEWIGEIPKHWSVTKLGYISDRVGDGIHSTPVYVDQSDYRFINGNNLIDGKIEFFESTRYVDEEEYNKYLIPLSQNTLLLSINGTIGNLSFYQGEKVILGKSSCYINLKSEINVEYLFWILKSHFVKTFFEKEVKGTTIFNLSLNSVRKTKFPLPSPDEQTKICEYLKGENSKLGSLIEKEEKRIRLLREYRQSLISSLVTGKVRVTEDMI